MQHCDFLTFKVHDITNWLQISQKPHLKITPFSQQIWALFGLEHLGSIIPQKQITALFTQQSPAARKEQRGAADRIVDIDSAGREIPPLCSTEGSELDLGQRNLGKDFRLMGRLEAELSDRRKNGFIALFCNLSHKYFPGYSPCEAVCSQQMQFHGLGRIWGRI